MQATVTRSGRPPRWPARRPHRSGRMPKLTRAVTPPAASTVQPREGGGEAQRDDEGRVVEPQMAPAEQRPFAAQQARRDGAAPAASPAAGRTTAQRSRADRRRQPQPAAPIRENGSAAKARPMPQGQATSISPSAGDRAAPENRSTAVLAQAIASSAPPTPSRPPSPRRSRRPAPAPRRPAPSARRRAAAPRDHPAAPSPSPAGRHATSRAGGRIGTDQRAELRTNRRRAPSRYARGRSTPTTWNCAPIRAREAARGRRVRPSGWSWRGTALEGLCPSKPPRQMPGGIWNANSWCRAMRAAPPAPGPSMAWRCADGHARWRFPKAPKRPLVGRAREGQRPARSPPRPRPASVTPKCLRPDQPGIEPILLHQRRVVAPVPQPSPSPHSAPCRQAMGDDQRAPSAPPRQCLLDQCLILGIERAGRSSSNRMRGSRSRARARAMRCRCPPDSRSPPGRAACRSHRPARR